MSVNNFCTKYIGPTLRLKLELSKDVSFYAFLCGFLRQNLIVAQADLEFLTVLFLGSWMLPLWVKAPNISLYQLPTNSNLSPYHHLRIGAGEVAWSIKDLLCKHENLNLRTQIHIKSWTWCWSGKERQKDLWNSMASQPRLIGKPHILVTTTVFIKEGWLLRSNGWDEPCFLMHTHTHYAHP